MTNHIYMLAKTNKLSGVRMFPLACRLFVPAFLYCRSQQDNRQYKKAICMQSDRLTLFQRALRQCYIIALTALINRHEYRNGSSRIDAKF